MRVLSVTLRALAHAAVAASWLLACAGVAAACSCMSREPCQAYGSAAAVFVGTVAAQREVEADMSLDGRSTFKARRQVSRFNVEEVFAGLGGATEVEVETDLSTSCAFPLQPGVRYLVYAGAGGGADAGRLSTGMCTGTASVEEAAGDLEYLRGARRTGAVVEGVVAFAGPRASPDGEPVGAETVGVTTVVAEGGGRRAEARVGAGGRYRFEGLPPGKYRITVPLPDELTTLDPYHPDMAKDMGIEDQYEVEVPARGCAVKHIAVAYNGRIGGRVTDAEGAPVAGLKVELLRLREPGAGEGEEEGEDFYIRTDADGQYSFKGLPAGRYLIGVRLGRYLWPDDEAAGFRRTFYPGVPKEQEAVAVSLGRGQNVTRRDFQLGPRLRERTISGVVVYADGRPAAGVNVRYQARTRDRKRSGTGGLKTDERGRFSFKGYEGTAFLVGAFTDGCEEPKCRHAHEAEVGPAGAPPRLRLVLNQPGSSCDRCRDFDAFEGAKP
ncbi:MAG TPA: carboxypeptidase-like regulatory domain-containing protein [Pyrinomonadaceae bacterium]|jgi:5-hydroxyisourate hydrolase-like protein (transthyretin family)|nr:carboxypeptidase-like regulatory domain-containing protein [Pyrinomonadaceae bacterium]